MAFFRYGKALLSVRVPANHLRHQHGYVVLLPEIGEEVPDKNPLYQADKLPKFDRITIENCRAAISKQTLDLEMGVQAIEKQLQENRCRDVIEDIVEPLEHLGNPMETSWGLSKTLYFGNNTMMPTSSYMAIHDRARQARAAKFSNKTIHSAIKEDLSSSRKERSGEELRVLQKFVLEGKLTGLELNEKQNKVFQHNHLRLNKERQEFKHKNDIGLRQHAQLIEDANVVRDFPQDLLKATAVNPNKYMEGPWRFTLFPQVYSSLLEHCPDREIRWILWKANAIRGSNAGERQFSTSLHTEEIRHLMNENAKLLGYENYVEMSMETKMANSKAEVQRVIQLLLERSKPAQDRELEDLLEFANERGFKTDSLELWDIPYWRRKQLKSLYDYDEEKIKAFFPLNTVLNGMFQLCENLFNIVIKARHGVSTWHRDVRFYDIFESHSSAPVAGFYIDPYARGDDKSRVPNSGWMIGIQSKSLITDSKPLAALIFNFEPPIGEQQSHLTFNDVKRLFQKFGHALQHLLTRTTYAEVAGLSNVEWDAVGVSGNMLSHWLANESVIESITCHRASGDKLPKKTFENLCNAERHMAGYDLSAELYMSALDLELYSGREFWLDIAKRLWPQYRTPKFDYKIDAHPCHFTQVFIDQWAAAYYSNVWSRMMAADVYSAFYEVKEDESKVRDVGKRFRDTFLALGGGRHPSQVFREFRGRDPSHKALLKILGLKKPKEIS